MKRYRIAPLYSNIAAILIPALQNEAFTQRNFRFQELPLFATRIMLPQATKKGNTASTQVTIDSGFEAQPTIFSKEKVLRNDRVPASCSIADSIPAFTASNVPTEEPRINANTPQPLVQTAPAAKGTSPELEYQLRRDLASRPHSSHTKEGSSSQTLKGEKRTHPYK